MRKTKLIGPGGIKCNCCRPHRCNLGEAKRACSREARRDARRHIQESAS